MSYFIANVNFVLMTRWGNPSEHCYVLAVTDRSDCGDFAKFRGRQEEQLRGGKYLSTVGVCSIDHIQYDREAFNIQEKEKIPPVLWSCIAVKYYIVDNEIHASEKEYSPHPRKGSNCHWNEMNNFVGIFSSEEKAKSFGNAMFPGWKLDITQHDVIYTEESK